MTIAELRKELNLSLEAFAQALGLTSKGYAYKLEQDGKCSVAVALKIESLSGGRIAARLLNSDVALLEDARGIVQTKDAA